MYARLSLALLFTAAAFAAADAKVLLMGGSAAAGGPASTAVIGDMRITADAIRYDPPQHRLQCEGNVTVCVAGNVTTLPAYTVALGDRPTVYVLNPNGVTIEAPAGSSARAAQPRFKGVELYSWREFNDPAVWWFALLPGTNRLKSETEVRASATRFAGVAELKRRMARLAAGERVFWVNRAPGGGYPDEDVVNDILAAAKQAHVNLALVPPPQRQDAPPGGEGLKLVPKP